MKYEVGDKVKVIPDLKLRGCYHDYEQITEYMLQYAGKETEITRSYDNETYRLKCDGGEWCWPEKTLILIPMTNADKIRNMTDEELAQFLFNYMILLTRPENIKTFGELLEWLEKPSELESKRKE